MPKLSSHHTELFFYRQQHIRTYLDHTFWLGRSFRTINCLLACALYTHLAFNDHEGPQSCFLVYAFSRDCDGFRASLSIDTLARQKVLSTGHFQLIYLPLPVHDFFCCSVQGIYHLRLALSLRDN